MAAYEEFSIDQGTDVAISLSLVNEDQTPKNLNGYSVSSQMRRTINTSDSDAITFTGVIITPASDGIVTLSLSNSQTSAITYGRYLYDVEISHLDSDLNTIVERILEGIIIVKPEITRT